METNASNDEGKMRFIALQIPLFMQFKSIHPLAVEGVTSLFIKAVVEKFKTNYEVKLVKSPQGIVESLTRNESDVFFLPMDLSHQEFQYIDYSHVSYETDTYIVSSDASSVFKSSSLFSFVSIYSSWVWFALGVSFVLFAIFWSLAENPRMKYSANPRNKILINENFLNTFRVLLNQGARLPPSKYGPLRLAVFCWVFGCFVLNAIFGGGLLSKLTLPPKTIYIETLEDTLKFPHLPLLIGKNTALENSIKNSNNNVRRQVWEQIVRHNYFGRGKTGKAKIMKETVRGENILFLEDWMVKWSTPVVHGCDITKRIHISEEKNTKFQRAFKLRKKLDPTKAKIFKETIQFLFEANIISRPQNLKYWKYEKCFVKDPVPLKKLEASSIAVVCYGLLLGYAISTITLIFELKYHPGTKVRRKITNGNKRV